MATRPGWGSLCLGSVVRHRVGRTTSGTGATGVSDRLCCPRSSGAKTERGLQEDRVTRAQKRDVPLIEPGKPAEPKRLHRVVYGLLSDDCPNEHLSLSLPHARTQIERWRRDFFIA